MASSADAVLPATAGSRLDSGDGFPWFGGCADLAATSRTSWRGTAKAARLATARTKGDARHCPSLPCGAAARRVIGLGVWGPSSR
jgi:hypothetical protein